jgi:hypothetical protein
MWFPLVPLEIFDRKKVPSGNFHAGTLFQTVIIRGTKGNHIFLELVAGK